MANALASHQIVLAGVISIANNTKTVALTAMDTLVDLMVEVA